MSSTLSAQTKINKDVPYGLTVAAAWSWRFVAIVAMLAVVWWLSGFVSLVVVPVIVAALLAVLLAPVYRGLRRGRLPGVFAALLCVLLLVATVLGLFWLAGQQLVQGFADLSDQLVQSAGHLLTWLQGQGLDVQLNQQTLDDALASAKENSSTLVNGALSFGSTALNVLTGAFIALFTLIFFLYDGDRIWRFLLGFVPRTSRDRVDVAGRSGWEALGSFVRVQILVAFIDAVGIGLGALLLGVPLAVPIAVLVFLGSFIPTIGAVVTGGIAVVIALGTQGPVSGLLMLGVVVLVQQLEGNILQPLVMGKAVSLHPLAVFLAVAAGSVVMGIVGAVFAVPLLAFVNAFVRALRTRDPHDEIHAGEQVYRPSESALAGARRNAQLDPDRDPRNIPGDDVDPEDEDGRTGSTATRVNP